MATDEFFIAAIELGSSKVTGMAGSRQPDGSMNVLAMAVEDSSSFIRKGLIYNVDKTSQCLKAILTKLQTKLNKRISKVYVGVGGQSLHTLKNSVARQLATPVPLSQELIDEILDANLNTMMADFDIIDVVPQEYKVGSNFQIDPVGVISDNVEGRFLNIVARHSVNDNLLKCFDQANITIADSYLSPKALAENVLTDAEKRSGCALVDLGADTTTVAVYKNNLLRHLAVIPLGGDNITKDLMSLQIEKDEAEEIKLKYGSAYTELDDEEEAQMITLRDGRNVDFKKICDIVEARAEEILCNVGDQIRRTGYNKDTLLAGIILTGGASNLPNIDKAFPIHTGFDKLKFVKSVLFNVRGLQPDTLIKDSRFNTILGLLAKGTENCNGGKLPDLLDSIEKEQPIAATSQVTNPTTGQVDSLAEMQRRQAAAKAKQEAEEAEKRKEEEAREAERQRKEAEKAEKARLRKEKWSKWKNKFSKIGRKISDTFDEEE